MADIAHLVSFGLGGHGVECSKDDSYGAQHGRPRTTYRISGYDSPESFVKALQNGEKGSYPDMVGCPVIDARAAFEEDWRLAINCPMPDPLIENGQESKCPEPDDFLLAGVTGAFQALLLKHKTDPEWKGLSRVSIMDYIVWMKEHGGDKVRLGVISKDLSILWED